MEFLLITWIIGFFVCAFVASQRGRSGIAWGFISLLISPLLALLVLIAIPSKRRATRRERPRNSYDEEDEAEEEVEEERPSARNEDLDRRRSPETAILRGIGGVLLVIGVSVVIVSVRGTPTTRIETGIAMVVGLIAAGLGILCLFIRVSRQRRKRA
jgi:hypothetical protein